MKNKLFKLLACFALLILSSAGPVDKSTPQKLDTKNSSIRFRLSSGQNVLNGKFDSYQARLFLNEKDFSKSKIEFDIDISKFSLDKSEELGEIMIIKNMLQNIVFEPAKFKSEFIKKQPDGSYFVSGVVSRSGNLWEMGFYLSPESISSKKSSFKVNLKGDFSGKEFSIPLSGNALVAGEVQFLK